MNCPLHLVKYPKPPPSTTFISAAPSPWPFDRNGHGESVLFARAVPVKSGGVEQGMKTGGCGGKVKKLSTLLGGRGLDPAPPSAYAREPSPGRPLSSNAEARPKAELWRSRIR